ncbi:cytochrome c1 [Paracoccus sp. p4-l81]|uniref:cytochrome c1 n=1 Tax=Paracoccus sp. p4-l81 TaxID=3342806 RepID=UPI0035B955E1
MRKTLLAAAAVLLTGTGVALAAGAHTEIHDVNFSFEGPFGKFDQHQLQRGLQVYTEVCSACHGMQFVPLRSLSDPNGPGLPEDQVRAYAANLTIMDAETGEERPRAPTDMFPFVADVDGTGPDLSVIAKARAGFHGPYGTGIAQFFKGIGGPEYLYSLLTGYHENPACAPDGVDGFYYNVAFAAGSVPDSCKDEHGVSTVPGSWIAMPPPVSDDIVTYADGTPATAHQIAEDISAFLMWTAEPKMMDRKQVGFVSVVFLALLTTLLYLTNKRLWAPHKRRSA